MTQRQKTRPSKATVETFKKDVDGALDKTNFRDFARRTIDSYAAKGMLLDAILWGQIIGHYENALDEGCPECSAQEEAARAIAKRDKRP
jgi:hypothetical protein